MFQEWCPLLSDLFQKANKIASFDILLFINWTTVATKYYEAIKKVNPPYQRPFGRS